MFILKSVILYACDVKTSTVIVTPYVDACVLEGRSAVRCPCNGSRAKAKSATDADE